MLNREGTSITVLHMDTTMNQLWNNYMRSMEQNQATTLATAEGINQWGKIIKGDASDLTEEQREYLHAALDVMSVLPGGGVYDWLNAELYAAEGNTEMAAASTLAVAVPGVLPALNQAAKHLTNGSDLLSLIFKSGSMDEVAEGMIKYGNEMQEAGEILAKEAVEGGLDVLNNLKPQNLMDELASSGVKYNPNDVIAVTKTADGKLLWLEQGNTQSGLMHILERHADDFASQGIDDIPQLLNNVLKNTPIKTGSNSKGPFADYVFNGNTYRVAYGTNGYIVSFYPID